MTGLGKCLSTAALALVVGPYGVDPAQAGMTRVLPPAFDWEGQGGLSGVIRAQAAGDPAVGNPSDPSDTPVQDPGGPAAPAPGPEEPTLGGQTPPDAPPATGGPLFGSEPPDQGVPVPDVRPPLAPVQDPPPPNIVVFDPTPPTPPAEPTPGEPVAGVPAPSPNPEQEGVPEVRLQNPALPSVSDVLEIAPLTAYELLSLPASVETMAVTRALMSLRDIERTCHSGAVAADYRVDCVAQSLRQAAAALPGRGELLFARRALLSAASELDQIVSAAHDPARGTIEAPVGGGSLAPRLTDLRAVQTEMIVAAQSAARAVIEEVQLVLLRSSDSFERHNASFQQIAMAIDSSKNLLRSS